MKTNSIRVFLHPQRATVWVTLVALFLNIPNGFGGDVKLVSGQQGPSIAVATIDIEDQWYSSIASGDASSVVFLCFKKG